MFDDSEHPRDLSVLEVAAVGSLTANGSKWEPYRLLDPAGRPAGAVAAFFADLLAAGRSEATVRSYGMDLLRWFRFLWAIGAEWNRATRVEARDFSRWMLVAGKPARPHWRTPGRPPEPTTTVEAYAPSVRAHAETVLRMKDGLPKFKDFPAEHGGSGEFVPE